MFVSTLEIKMQASQVIQETLLRIRSDVAGLISFGVELGDRINGILGDTERLSEILSSLQLLNPETFDRIQSASAITTETTTAALPAHPILGDEDPILGDDSPILGDEIRIAAQHQDRGRSRIRFTAAESDLIIRLRSENTPLPVIARRLNKTVDQVRYHHRWVTQRRPPRPAQSSQEGTLVQVATPERPRMNRI